MQNQSPSKSQSVSSNTSSNKPRTPGMSSSSTGMMNAESSSEKSHDASTSMKSIGSMIGDNLGKEAQARVDKVVDQFSGYLQTSKDYVSENPKEAIALVASFAAAAWGLLYTKPGRQLFDKSAAILVPQISKWATDTFSGSTNNTH